MTKTLFLTFVLITILAFPFFGQIASPFNVSSTDTTICNGQSVTISVHALPGSITNLACESASNTGNLFATIPASGISSSISYSGGNGGVYNSQTISSTGVLGLSATLSAGVFNVGDGDLVFTITGTASTFGYANFEINIGGQICTFNVIVYGPQPAYPTGSNFCVDGATLVFDVTNPITGRTWMDRNLGATHLPTNLLSYDSYGYLYQWGRKSDGHQCRNSQTTLTMSTTDNANTNRFIKSSSSDHDWRIPQNDNLWQGINGSNNPCPIGYRIPTDSELAAEIASWSTNDINGGLTSPLKWIGGGFRDYYNALLYNVGAGDGGNWSSTVNGTYANHLDFNFSADPSIATISTTDRAYGYSVRCIKEISGSIGSLDCGSSSVSQTIYANSPVSGVTVSIPYTAGNGGYFPSQTYTSTGVTGLVVSIRQGLFSNGSGNLVYDIAGTPNTNGTANFNITVCGQSCNISLIVANQVTFPSGSIYCNAVTTIVNDVTNPITGKVWMDRNLGATQVATSSLDANSYGDLYQWGRRSDGHQCRASFTTTTLSSSNQPTHGDFILGLTNNLDWRDPQNINLWQGMYGVNNPCPFGYSLPSRSEFDAESTTWTSNNAAGAFASPLKLPMSGFRYRQTGDINSVGSKGFYWSSTISSTTSMYLDFTNTYRGTLTSDRSTGGSVRCIKVPSGTISALNCANAILTGNLVIGIATNNVSVSVPYSGGNSGYYNSQTFASSGVTGLTAELAPYVFNTGSGNLTLTITGTPSSIGIASFVLNIGGQICTLNLTVYGAQPNYPAGSVFCSGHPTIVVDVTNPSTGRTWMDRNLGAIQVASSSTDTYAYGDLYQWGRGTDGHQCRNSTNSNTLSSSDAPSNASFIFDSYNGDWRSPQNTNLWQVSSGTNNPCPTGYRIPTYTELVNEVSTWSIGTSVGAMASPLKLPMAGYRLYTDGSLAYVGSNGRYWTNTVNSTVSSSFVFNSSSANGMNSNRALGYSVRCIKEMNGTISSLICANKVVSGTLIASEVANNVTVSVPYTGGNGGYYASQSITSTGVTGLTASLTQDLFTYNTGNLVFSITGMPISGGIASFTFTIAGQTCSFDLNVYNVQPAYPNGTVFCNGYKTIVNDVVNPSTGKVWMDRNLGATRAATSTTDASSYGDLYQWGRRSDGHQCRNSTVVFSSSPNNQPASSDFIKFPYSPYDWRFPQNSNLWQGSSGINNPCPTGYRLPTDMELNEERLSWNVNTNVGAMASTLKLPMGGYRWHYNGSLTYVGSYGYYWSSSVTDPNSNLLIFGSGDAYMSTIMRASGATIRCIKE